MAIKLLPDLETQQRLADATEEIANKLPKITHKINIMGFPTSAL